MVQKILAVNLPGIEKFVAINLRLSGRFQISNPITTAEVDRNFANLYSRWHENGARPEQTDGKLAFQRLRQPFLRHKIDARNDLMRHLRINDVTWRSHPPVNY